MVVALLEPTDRDDIDSLSEELSEGLLEIHEIEQRAARLELDEEVDVAVCRIVTTSDRSEQRDRAATMTANDLVDLVPLRLDPSPALPHGLKGTEAVCAGLALGPVPAQISDPCVDPRLPRMSHPSTWSIPIVTAAHDDAPFQANWITDWRAPGQRNRHEHRPVVLRDRCRLNGRERRIAREIRAMDRPCFG